ncbi:poly-beta-1,6-N-acetyl-D-glucosamine N-deacetylase PgaB [Neisseria sp. Dent CA1/247]|uniref:poly-beta-1,6-N-acetyl-D-glucosamine N-deacetylase PgaB n=1 Tax=Neisseria sp. Dent CA1/247 TaxID=2912675 RepID=UPI001FD132E0|nr:poly-beta-1,6-N-acetyl-D-glucosamine N-deacetylase PgaB [Neisseria sp. Dent CA1/247]UOO76767.1 poly-beta-1,6-N-acetyl-D-glucosamine N-deacetylase PgaB [Neisseria sp. Dent CA1/247]
MKYKSLIAALLLAGGFQAANASDVRYGVMCYHDVIDNNQPPPVFVEDKKDEMQGEIRRSYFPQTITVERLTAHFNWLRDNGYTPVSFKQIEEARAGRGKLPPKPVLLTFDDGYISFYTKIYPLLKAFNYPAVYALVTGWLEVPPGGTIAYGKKKLPRSAFITWDQVREMQKSGLIEIASHTHDLHHSVIGNPYGSQFAAMFPAYRNGRYETKAEYEQRIRNDLQRSVDLIVKHTGTRPNVLVWPYGQFSQTAQKIAHSVGLVNDFTLFDAKLNTTEQPSVGRALIDTESGYPMIKSYLAEELYEAPHQRAVHVDLGDMYDTDPAGLEKRFDKLIERIYKLGITTVYLQAFADDNGDGVAEAAYFPNRHLKMKADLFSRVSWQLITRSNVKVYAKMPLTAFDLGKGYDYIDANQAAAPHSRSLNLSPNSEKNRRAITEIYEDLAYSSRFNGLVFHEGLTPGAGEGQPDGDLTDFTDTLKQAVLKYSYNSVNEMRTVRSVPADLTLNPEAQQRLADTLARYARHYDYTAVPVAPYTLGGQEPNRKEAARWVTGLAGAVKSSNVPLGKTIFDLQSVNPLTGQPMDTKEMTSWLKLLKKEGVKNLAYHPDNFLNNQPPLKAIKPDFSIQH